jgi:hypothetical protein
VRVQWRRRARRRRLRRPEAVGEEVAQRHWRWEAARRRRGRGCGGGAGGGAEREVGQWRELALHVSVKWEGFDLC